MFPIYAFYIEPVLRLRIRKWSLTHPDWSEDAPMRIAVLADLHVGEPTVSAKRLAQIVKRTNALGADLIVFLGDLQPSIPNLRRRVPIPEAASILGKLRAPLGVFAIQGNHDWWHDPSAMRDRKGPTLVQRSLEQAGIPVLENKSVPLGNGVWLAGIGDQIALPRSDGDYDGVDDLSGTLAQVPDGTTTLLLVHEPDIFPEVPITIPLTLAGHTHGGQVNLLGYRPAVPSRFYDRYAYGPVTENGHHIVISGGIGCSHLSLRFGVPPEITLVDIRRG